MDVFEFLGGLAVDGEEDGVTGFATEALDGLGEWKAIGEATIDFKDAIAGKEAGFEARPSLDGHVDGESVVFGADGDAKSAKFPLGVIAHFEKAFGVEELAVGVE